MTGYVLSAPLETFGFDGVNLLSFDELECWGVADMGGGRYRIWGELILEYRCREVLNAKRR